MNEFLKAVLRQITPPILLPIGKALFDRQKESPLKAEHDRRNLIARDDEIVLREGLSLKVHPESRNGFEHFCHIAAPMVRELDCFIEHTMAKSRLLDVGALHGIFSLVFAANNAKKKVVAVDPSPIAFARLLYHIHKNKLGNIAPVECALSDGPGTLRMHYEWEHAVAARPSGGKQTYLMVEKMSGDDLCKSLSFPPDVIKIDVEGHEIKVLRGLAETIARNKPLIFLEVHPRRIIEEGDTLRDLMSILGKNQYNAAFVSGQSVALDDLTALTEDERLLLRPT